MLNWKYIQSLFYSDTYNDLIRVNIANRTVHKL